MDLGMTWWLMLIAEKTAPSNYLFYWTVVKTATSVGVLAKMWASSHKAQR